MRILPAETRLSSSAAMWAENLSCGYGAVREGWVLGQEGKGKDRSETMTYVDVFSNLDGTISWAAQDS